MLKGKNVKVVILAGGLGTRISEETGVRPKPMVMIGGKPILWHIMKIYSAYGINDFIICLGYKGEIIKEYFNNYFHNQCDVTYDYSNNSMNIHNNKCEDWKVTLVDTGEHSMTGCRIKQIEKYIDNTFMVTYGDGVADIDINKLFKFHKLNKKIATVSSYQYSERFGVLEFGKNKIVHDFREKQRTENWINMGYYVFEPEVFKYIDSDVNEILEKKPINKLVSDSEIATYQHFGFWKCMDTMNDKRILESMWEEDPAWDVWNEKRRLSS